MKVHVHVAITATLILCCAILGISKKSSYTNVSTDQSFVNEFSVAEMPTAFAKEECRRLEHSLPSSPVILKVTPAAPLEYFFGGRQQKVRILEVYAGEGLSTGDEIYVTADNWKVYIDEKAMDSGFVNNMKEGSDYLVFLTEPFGYAKDAKGYDKSEHIAIYRLQTDEYINAQFICDSRDNVIYPFSGESSYVPYAEVMNNEFFAAEQEGLDAFLTLKTHMLRKYVH